MQNHETNEKNHVMDQRIEGFSALSCAEAQRLCGGRTDTTNVLVVSYSVSGSGQAETPPPRCNHFLERII